MKRLFLLLLASPTFADAPEIVNATAQASGDTWKISVTLAHPDTGWDHYADGWRVLDENGTELGLRVLHHPHVNEQPFTRSQGGVQIPTGIKTIRIEARCNVDGWSGTYYTLNLP
jgi:hypothetical protein